MTTTRFPALWPDSTGSPKSFSASAAVCLGLSPGCWHCRLGLPRWCTGRVANGLRGEQIPLPRPDAPRRSPEVRPERCRLTVWPQGGRGFHAALPGGKLVLGEDEGKQPSEDSSISHLRELFQSRLLEQR